MKFLRAIAALLIAAVVAAIIIGNSPYRPIREIYTQVAIDAPAERVWTVLTDTPRYQEWNPFLKSITGDLRPGSRLHVTIQFANGRTAPIHPKVLVLEPNRELTWRGSTLIPGIFDGEHTFEIAPTSATSCRFIQREKFSGALVPSAWNWITIDVIAGFRAMNQALKLRAEQK